MKRSYLDYALSVIVSRALPDVRDGLKPVHRRIIYSMTENGYVHDKPFRKSARVVGDVIGKYHPHGDSSIYEAVVRMAQPFSMGEVLIKGQGNFGSVDGDPAAAMRYTEVKLSRIASCLTEDLYRDTVDFRPNYDESLQEPTVLPTKFPNLLVNGAGGIAVGMATNIPPHNLGEITDACVLLIDNPDATADDIAAVVKGPDFPTGASIVGRSGILSAFRTGRGSVIIRARAKVEEIRKDRFAIIVTEIPYQVNKARLIEKIASLVNEKTLEGISDLRDESDREGIRIVIELKKDANPSVVLNRLYRDTALRTSFGVNMLALRDGRPQLMNLKEILEAFIAFRREVTTRRTVFELNKIRDRAHILIGLAAAVANIDRVIGIIRSAPNPESAREKLTGIDWPAEEVEPLILLVNDPNSFCANGRFRMTDVQAKAVLDLKLHRLTALERTKISDELTQSAKEIKDLLDILGSEARVMAIIREECLRVKAEFATPRRTLLEEDDGNESEDEDFIQREEMVVTFSNGGYVKRVPLSTYRAQKRGGKGKTGMTTREEDFVRDLFVADTHTPVLFFIDSGIVYQTKVYKLPLSTPQSRGKALVNLFPMKQEETVAAILALPEDPEAANSLYIVFATSKGNVRRNRLTDFTDIRANGKIAMKPEGGEKLISAAVCRGDSDILISTKFGKCVRFPLSELRVFSGRASTGVRAVKLLGDDEVISMTVLNNDKSTVEEREDYVRYSNRLRRSKEEIISDIGEPPARYEEMKKAEQTLLTVTENGFAKRTSSFEYRTCRRGTQGVKNIEMDSKNGKVVAVFPAEEEDEIMLVTDGGKLIRCSADEIRITGRATRGVIVFRAGEGEKVVSAVRLADKD
jgi:DNA gyrase subunit A